MMVIPKKYGVSNCEHCHEISEWLILDENDKNIAVLCTKHKDKFMMEQI